jgi:hypothetical protein
MDFDNNRIPLRRGAGGIGPFAVIFFSFLLFLLSISCSVHSIIEITGGKFTFSTIRDLFIGVSLGLVCSTHGFMYWKYNFIEISIDTLNISYLDRKKRSLWPKFIKVNIPIKDIKKATLSKVGIFGTPFMKIIGKNNKPFHIDTKPFTRKTFFWLFEELKKKGIEIEIQEGSI